MNTVAGSSSPEPDEVGVIIGLDGTPEDTANEMIADTLPTVFLDQIDLDSRDGLRLFLPSLLRRRYQASFERAEVIGFVERNRAVLSETGVLDQLASMIERAMDEEAERNFYIDVIDQMRHVLDGHPESVDLISNRLLWLCVALDFHVSTGRLDHSAAVKWLERPDNRARLSSRAVLYLFQDYLRSMDDLDDLRPEYVLLITECALLADDTLGLKCSRIFMRMMSPASDWVAWLSVWRRLKSRLEAVGAWTAEDQAALELAATRFESRVNDDDF